MIRITVMSVPMLSSIIRTRYTPPPDVSIQLVESTLDEAVAVASRLEASGGVDVFVSAGSIAKVIAKHVKKPQVEINVTGFDILHALKTAKKISDRVAVFTFLDQISHLSATLSVLSMQVRMIEYDYQRLPDLERKMVNLLDEGIRTIIGSSIIYEMAQRHGLHPIFIYSDDSIMRALDQAVQIAKFKQQEAEERKKFETILDFTSGGIIATDRDGKVTAFNPAAEKISGIDKTNALGKPIGKLLSGLRLSRIIQLREPELNQIASVGNKRVLADYIPIVSDNGLTGSVVAFQDFASIQEAEEKIRSKLFDKGFRVETTIDDIRGRSRLLKRVKEEARLYASSNATTLILGESGTGKELFARAIHRASTRSGQPFVAINCGAFPEPLLESELFGYDEGAFTGARRGGKKGLIELAHQGTLFLDEIAEMPTSLQTRMLRVLEEREVMHVGGDKVIKVDIRVIAATNKDLRALIRAGGFREDLYYRLNVLNLRVPPLRDRPEDIAFLAGLFLSEMIPDLPAAEIKKIADDPCLLRHDWPGNVRELKNFIERFAVLLPAFSDANSLLASLFASRGATGREDADAILQALRATGGNRAKAAKKLGVSRSTLWRKLKTVEGRRRNTSSGRDN